MSDKPEDSAKEIDEIRRRVENLISAEHLSEEQKLSFVWEALKIIGNQRENKDVI